MTSINEEKMKQLDRQGRVKRNLRNPIAKDTLPVPYNGFSIIRFIADNPGRIFLII